MDRKPRAFFDLPRLAQSLRARREELNCSESHLARSIGVTHPTLGRMLNPQRPGSEGVAISYWFRALQITGDLTPIVEGLERGASEALRASGRAFEPLIDAPIHLTGQPDSPPEPEDEVRIDLALARSGHAMRSTISARPIRSARQLAMALGVTQPTLSNLLSPAGTGGGGTAIRLFLRACDLLELGPMAAGAMRPAPQQKPRAQAADQGARAEFSPGV